MTLLIRIVPFVFSTAMVIGAMLLTVHWARAQMTQDKAERAIELQAIKQYHC